MLASRSLLPSRCSAFRLLKPLHSSQTCRRPFPRWHNRYHSVGAVHDFHNPTYVREWAERFEPTKERIALFDHISNTIARADIDDIHVVELGTGPGYLAAYILERHPNITYEAVDFSEAFSEVAKEKLGPLADRVTFTTADLLSDSWSDKLSKHPDMIVSTWTLHDLGGVEPVRAVYKKCYEILPYNGALINGDFVKPEKSKDKFEPGRFEVSTHVQMLEESGFSTLQNRYFEHNLVEPTPGQNYNCFTAWK